MPLEMVTITGADESVPPSELRKLSAEFPFVEWGILVGSHFGSRFPSIEWIHELVEERCYSGNAMKLSLHVCGKLLRGIARGDAMLKDFIGPKLASFSRVQLNWHGEQQLPSVGDYVLSAFCKMDVFGWDPTIIFQFDGVNDEIWRPVRRRFRCAGLFDTSHGTGVCPGDWPKPYTDLATGWAGGLGPDNLATEIPQIDEVAFSARGYWIDMETKVRTEEQFDLEKVRSALEIASNHIEEPKERTGD